MHKLELKYIKYDENMSSGERRALEHTEAYQLLDSMLKKHLSIDSYEILRNENGKPYIEKEGVHFSLAHTDGLVVCAISDSQIGVDCERILTKSNEEIQKFAKRFFVENEIILLENSKCPSLDFYKIWTGKEATIKKLGGNMSYIKKIDTTKENILFSLEKDYIISINI